MYNFKKVCDDLYYVGASDRELDLFENIYPIKEGMSYNSYVLMDEKTVLLDTVGLMVEGVFLDNIEKLLDGRKLDYIIINHMEPDHTAMLRSIMVRYPEASIVCNQKTSDMIAQFFDKSLSSNSIVVKEGDTLSTGKHNLKFVFAPMVHWPEVMMTYDETSKVLFSADAFGTFGALSGSIFADEVDFKRKWISEARRYYANIVGKYGTQVKSIIKKLSEYDIGMICPLHGPIWRTDLIWYISLYQKWASYEPEEKAVLIVYGSVYGHTANAADIVASKLADRGVLNISEYDVSKTDSSFLVSEAFRCSHIVLASTTYNAGIFFKMENYLNDLKEHNFQNRTVAIIENGSWAPTSGKLMKDCISSMKNMVVIDNPVTIRSSLKEEQLGSLDEISDSIADSLLGSNKANEVLDNKSALFNLSYGLFVLSSKSDKKESGCIINTVTQVADSPLRISISVNKLNYTHDIIVESGVFNVSVLTEKTPFEVFKHFGFQSGRDVDKFADKTGIAYSNNGIPYLSEFANSVISCKVESMIDVGSHTLFIASVTELKSISKEPSATYAYYHKNIKPQPAPAEKKIVGWRCKICGYIYEGEELPADFICPLCKHGAEAFEKIN